MRKVVLYTLMSLDGAVEDPGRYFEPAQPGQPPEFDALMDAHEAEITASQDAVLLGRRMYDEWSKFWPTMAGQPFADFINPVKKYVVTSSPLVEPWTNSEAVAGPLPDLIRELKAQPGRDIGVHGSIELAQSLLDEDLVDEMHLVVGPQFGHPGRRLFDRAREVRRAELIRAASSPTGSLLLSYRLQ